MLSFADRLLSKVHFRDRSFFYSAFSSLFTRGVNLFVSLLSLPLIYNCIGKERYGMMLTITSIATVINFADLGLGFGLQNKIPQLIQQKDDSLKRTLSSAFFFLLVTSAFILIVFFIVTYNIHWAQALRLKSSAAIEEVNLSVWLFALCITTVIPFSIIQKLQIGAQEGYIANFWITGGNVCSLFLLYIAFLNGASTPVIILALYGTNTLFVILNYAYHFFIEKPFLLPSFALVELKMIKAIVTDSFLFFLVQMLSLLLFTCNNFFLIYYHGPEQVTEFNIAYKLALFFLIPLEASAPYITPAINDASIKSDHLWVKKYTRKGLLLASILSVVTAITVYYLGNFIIGNWLGESAVMSTSVLASVAFFMLLYANLGCVLSYVMLSSAFIKQKTIVYSFAVVVTIITKIIFIRLYSVEGSFWSTSIPMFVLYIIPCLYILKTKKLV